MLYNWLSYGVIHDGLGSYENKAKPIQQIIPKTNAITFSIGICYRFGSALYLKQ